MVCVALTVADGHTCLVHHTKMVSTFLCHFVSTIQDKAVASDNILTGSFYRLTPVSKPVNNRLVKLFLLLLGP